MNNRVAIVHGVNLDQLGRRPAAHYGTLRFDELERRIGAYADELDLEPRFFQTNAESELVNHLHHVNELADAIVINPGAWTHYAWAIRDALEIADLPTVEVHLSDIENREEWRRTSVISEICLARVAGRGPEGYREALELLKRELAG